MMVFNDDRSRSRSRSYSPSHPRRHARGVHSDDAHRSKDRAPKIEYITEFGGSDGDEPKFAGYSPPPSPPSQADALNRSEHSTFNSCKDRLEVFTLLQHIVHFVTSAKLLWFRIDHP